MRTIAGFELFAADLPLRIAFKHGAAERTCSDSLFLRCVLDDGSWGWGESLPCAEVTGESRDGAFELLAGSVLPALVGRAFGGLSEVESFLGACDGRAPAALVDRTVRQTAAWCAVDLALLDAFGRAFGEQPLAREPKALPVGLQYSGMLSVEAGLKRTLLLLAHRLWGFRAVKLEIGPETGARELASVRRWLGPGVDVRVDANRAWTVDRALAKMNELARCGVRSFEQPIAAHDFDGLARLVAETGFDVVADESVSTRESLVHLMDVRAATAINARISKCGGLVATLARCREALALGLAVQIGCQAGESSLLSAAHLRLAAAVGDVRSAEGCFGTLLLEKDPGRPRLRFGWRGRPPVTPRGPGFGVDIDRALVDRHGAHRVTIGQVAGTS